MRRGFYTIMAAVRLHATPELPAPPRILASVSPGAAA
jgi:hypothetical protein